MNRHASLLWPIWFGGKDTSCRLDLFYFTKKTQFNLHRSTSLLPLFWSLRRRLLGNERHQPQQVFDAEMRATGRRPHERIRRR
jgi:hypothetical protein